jgi:hypothetical protein
VTFHDNGQLHKLEILRQLLTHNGVGGQLSPQFCCGVKIMQWMKSTMKITLHGYKKKKACWSSNVEFNKPTTNEPLINIDLGWKNLAFKVVE